MLKEFNYIRAGRVWGAMLTLMAAVLLVAACGGNGAGDAAGDATDPAEGESVAIEETVRVEMLPSDEQQGGSLAVRVLDGEGDPVTDASVRLEGDMNHAGMIPVISEPVEHEADGIYRVPFEFTMLGDWIISVFVTTADGVEHESQIELGVRNEGFVIQ